MPFRAPDQLLDAASRPTPGQIREQMLAAGDYLRGLRATSRDSRGDSFEVDVRSAVDFIHDWDPVLQAYERGLAVDPNGVRDGSTGPAAATRASGSGPAQTLGQMFTGRAGYRDFSGRGAASSTFHEEELDGTALTNSIYGPMFGFRTQLDEASSSANYFVPVASMQLPPVLRKRRLFLRDLVAVQGTGLANVPYIRELNPASTELGASATSEASSKAEVTMTFEHDDAFIRKISAWIPATTEIIDDAPTLRGYIDTRLAYLLAVREEELMLNGSGTAPQIKGIRNFSGLQTRSFTTDVPTTIGLAISQIENVDGEPDAFAMNPLRFWEAITTRSSTAFDGGWGGAVRAPFDMPESSYWGLTAIRSRSMPYNKALVGSFRMGATLFDREKTTIRVGNQHSTFFVDNKVAILAEERIGLAVHRPDLFVDATVQ